MVFISELPIYSLKSQHLVACIDSSLWYWKSGTRLFLGTIGGAMNYVHVLVRTIHLNSLNRNNHGSNLAPGWRSPDLIQNSRYVWVASSMSSYLTFQVSVQKNLRHRQSKFVIVAVFFNPSIHLVTREFMISHMFSDLKISIPVKHVTLLCFFLTL